MPHAYGVALPSDGHEDAPTMGTDFADLLADIEREAVAGGPEAVKLLSALDAHFSTVLNGH